MNIKGAKKRTRNGDECSSNGAPGKETTKPDNKNRKANLLRHRLKDISSEMGARETRKSGSPPEAKGAGTGRRPLVNARVGK